MRTKEAWLEMEYEMLFLQPQPTMNLIRALAATVLLATLSSCAAPAKVSEEKDANGKKIEYVYYTPTGSSIPIRVRKDQLASTDAEQAAMDNKLEEIQRAASGPPQEPGGK